MGEIVSRKMFAKMVGKSERWVGKWIDEGMPIAGGGGKGRPLEIDTEDAIDWLIRREIRRQIGDSGPQRDASTAADRTAPQHQHHWRICGAPTDAEASGI